MPCQLVSQGYTVNRLNPTSAKGLGGFYSFPGECVVRGGCGCHSRACLGARRGGSSCGRARLDVVDEKDMMQPLDSVQVELGEDACCVESEF
jgi:hypothetical protein